MGWKVFHLHTKNQSTGIRQEDSQFGSRVYKWGAPAETPCCVGERSLATSCKRMLVEARLKGIDSVKVSQLDPLCDTSPRSESETRFDAGPHHHPGELNSVI